VRYFWYFLDWFDDMVLRHPWYWLCKFTVEHYPEDNDEQMVG